VISLFDRIKLTSRSDSLPILLVLHITSGKHTRNASLSSTRSGNDVSVLVHLKLVLEKVSRRIVANSVEQTVRSNLLRLASLVVLDHQALHQAPRTLVALDFHTLSVVAHLDLGVGRQTARVGLGSAQEVLAHEHSDLGGLLGQVNALLDRRITTADHDERLLAEDRQAAVADSAGRHTVAPVLLLASKIETPGLGAGRNDDAVGGVRLLLEVRVIAHGVQPVLEGALRQVDLAHGLADDLGAAALALGAHLVHERRALDVGEAGEVLDLVGGGELAAGGDAEGEEALVHDGLEVGARGVDGGGVAGGAGADDDELGVHAARLLLESGGRCGGDVVGDGGGGGGVVEGCSGGGGGCEGKGDGGAEGSQS